LSDETKIKKEDIDVIGAGLRGEGAAGHMPVRGRSKIQIAAGERGQEHTEAVSSYRRGGGVVFLLTGKAAGA